MDIRADSSERNFIMKIVLLNAATFPIYRSGLASLLIDAVTYGASVGYNTHTLSQEEAEGYFHSLHPAIEREALLLWIARDEIGIIGTIQLVLCQKPNGLNRAEIQKLLVHSRSRRTGIGHKLIIAARKHRSTITPWINISRYSIGFFR